MKFDLPDCIPDKRRKIIDSILSNVICSNSGQNHNIVCESKPSRKFFIGTMSPRPTREELEKFANKVSPPTIGLEFLIKKDFSKEAEITIKPSGEFYYRIFPSYEDQLEYSNKTTTEKSKSARLMEVFKKIHGEIEPVTLKIKDIIEKCEKEDEYFINMRKECEKIWEEAKSDPDFFVKKKKSRSKWPRVPLTEIESEDKYEYFRTKELGKPADCPWNMGIYIEVFETENGWRFIVSYTNLSEFTEDPTIENTIFEALLNIKLNGEKLKKFKLDHLEENYKHDRLIEASGVNCSFYSNSNSEIETAHSPIYIEKRRMPVDCDADLKFETLADSPFKSLDKVSYFLKGRIEHFKSKYGNTLNSEVEKESFKSDVKMAERELERFNNGVKALKNYPKCLRAFKLANKSFLYSSKADEEAKFDSWYPFQIAFFVSLVPDILHPHNPQEEHYRNLVDLLYFPTGGGKTEAFLGLAVFQAFLDRIMGKRFGVSALTKFPLRMLSLQQLQRIANIFAQAELVRQEEKDFNGDESEFSVGYFVGKTSTPNKLILYDRVKGKYYDYLDELEKDKDKLDEYQIVMKCPFCRKRSVKLKVDKESRRILHVCTAKGCERELPIYISDSEIYRFLPTFIVGTLDKLASVGLQINMRNILGGIKYKCPKHGFSSSEKCIEYGSKYFPVCTTRKEEMESVPKGDYGPSLIIQDEMHLIRDAWGTFNSHYETTIDKIISELSECNKSVKKIAATATISPLTYQEHVRDLYMREPVLFPSNLEMFTNESENVSRVIIGLMPHGQTHINAVEKVVGSIAVNTQKAIVNGGFSKQESRDFWTILSYHNKRNDAYQMGRSIGTRINENMIRPESLKDLQKKTLTGEVTFREIRNIMDSIEYENDFNKTIDALVATSIISHGVDIPKLNLMSFMGMPSNNAEYIQALSRIGRRSPGVAFVIFNPTRERDQSYFKYFIKFNQLRDLLIESIPICRWSEKAIERTCPGIFMASLLCNFDFIARSKGRYGDIKFVEPLKNALSDQAFLDEDIQRFVNECYQSDKSERPEEITELVNENVSKHINSIIAISGQQAKRKFIGMCLSPKALFSFRDIDASVNLSLTSETHAALKSGVIQSARGGEE